MKTQSALDLFQYWNRLRAGSLAPRRMDIEPSDIRDVLSQTFILESNSAKTEMVFRVAGTSISNFVGRSLRGTAIANLFPAQSAPVINRLIKNCYSDRSIIVLELNAVSKSGREAVLELLMLPLQSERGGHRILGCMVPFQTAFWHGMESIEQISLQSIRVVDPEREPMFLANRPKVDVFPPLAPAEDEFQPGLKAPSQKGVRLLVIEGGKSTKKPEEITKH